MSCEISTNIPAFIEPKFDWLEFPFYLTSCADPVLVCNTQACRDDCDMLIHDEAQSFKPNLWVDEAFIAHCQVQTKKFCEITTQDCAPLIIKCAEILEHNQACAREKGLIATDIDWLGYSFALAMGVGIPLAGFCFTRQR